MDPFNLPPEIKEQRLRAIQARLANATPRSRRRRIARRLRIALLLALGAVLWWLLARA